MRIAILSDIHGNRTAFEAVLSDLRQTAPDLILHGGDLADSGSSPVEIVDQIRDLGWAGVAGNTDEMLFRRQSLEEFASRSSVPPALWTMVREIAAATRGILGEERLAWLRRLPYVHMEDAAALVHASPATTWQAPAPEATDAELAGVYAPLNRAVAVYGHIHRPHLRSFAHATHQLKLVANTGSVGLTYDGDCRASYLLLDGPNPTIRRVEYDLDKELQRLSASGLPHTGWIAAMLRTGLPQMPPPIRPGSP